MGVLDLCFGRVVVVVVVVVVVGGFVAGADHVPLRPHPHHNHLLNMRGNNQQ